MSTLYLLRHGQASFGADDYDQLSPLGAQQALDAGRFLAARVGAFNRVLMGPCRRHRQTARGALAAFKTPREPEIHAALDEFAQGHTLLAAARERRVAAGLAWPEARSEQMRLYMAEIRRWALEGGALPGVPTLDAFNARLSGWLDALAVGAPRGSRVLAVTSAGVIAVVMCKVLRLPPARMIDFVDAIGNAAVTEIEFSGVRTGLRSFNVATAAQSGGTTRI